MLGQSDLLEAWRQEDGCMLDQSDPLEAWRKEDGSPSSASLRKVPGIRKVQGKGRVGRGEIGKERKWGVWEEHWSTSPFERVATGDGNGRRELDG